MSEFAERTGLSQAGRTQRRYLWTDAFAACNFLGFYRKTGDENFKELSLLLIDQVHRVLGRHRDDDSRRGWISGLDQPAGERHPTIGGLRIGKELMERTPHEPANDPLEWERDGQYYHYLTKWMHALGCAATVTGNAIYRHWAVELARTAYARFSHDAGGGQKRLYWKMSIDLSRPLVTSMGHHDPLDGLVTSQELQAEAVNDPEELFELADEIDGLAAMCRGKDWTTDDPLGIGGLLADAWAIAQLMDKGAFPHEGLLTSILDACRMGMGVFARSGQLSNPASNRLAFREVGLAIGLHALEKLEQFIQGAAASFRNDHEVVRQIRSLIPYCPMAEQIEDFWLQPATRKTALFMEHIDINSVMLATSLAPDGFLML